MLKLLYVFFTQSVIQKIVSFALAVFMLSACQPNHMGSANADLIFTNARVYTVDEAQPWATAVAVRNGQIIGVGSDKDVSKWANASSRIIDLQGKLLLPSFGDAHVHPVYGGLAYARCSMHATETLDGYKDIIKKCVDNTKTDRWIYGVGWRPGLFPPDGIPSKKLLDEISSDRPMMFLSTGGHSLWLNSKALALAGINKDTPNPLNGRIDRDPVTGELLGGLQESAKDLVEEFLPNPTQEDLEKAIVYAIEHFNTLGITNILDAGVSVDTNGISPTLEAYKTLQTAGKLNAHAEVAVKWENEGSMEQVASLLSAAKNVSGPSLASHTLKIWIDGVIAQRTAAMLEPYSDAHSEFGEPTIRPEVLNDIVTRFDAAGFQVMIHAIGDKAIRMSLDAFEQAQKSNGKTNNHHQITHTEFVAPDDITRFAQLGIIANFQPLWSTMDPYMQMTAVRVGTERMQHVYPAHSVLQAGGEMVYGSDWSVASANPLLGIEVAITRRQPGSPDAQPLLPEEAVTLEQAIKAYTLMVAKVNHNDNKTGSISVGKSADLVVLSQDIFTISPYDISKTNVLLTLYEGRAVHGNLKTL